MRVIIPMAGDGTRFSNYGFKTPKYLLPLTSNGIPMIELAINTLNVESKTEFIFIIKDNIDMLTKLLNNICIKYDYICHIITVDNLTEGPASSCYLAKDLINDDDPLLISNSDQVLDWDYNLFKKTCENYDGCVLTYKAEYTPIIGTMDKHSFIEMDENNIYAKTLSEKLVISNNMLVGVHYYSKGSLFIKAYEEMIKTNERAPNGEFYISLSYNPLIKMGYKIGQHKLNMTEHFYPVGEPKDYFNYLRNVSKWNYEKNNISNMKRGWIIGDFIPSILRTQDFEVGILSHKKNEIWPIHIHKETTEINVLLSGKMTINEEIINPKDVFIFYPGMISAPKFLEDCELICIKYPSRPYDKHII